MSDNYQKLTLLAYKKNIDLTEKIAFLLTDQIKNMNLTFSTQSSCRKSHHSYFFLKIGFVEKNCPNYKRWSPRGRPWPRRRPRGHILKSLALTLPSKSQVLENCPVLDSRTALFFELLKFCWKTPETSRKIC